MSPAERNPPAATRRRLPSRVGQRRVVHVLHTWGVPSQTFVRSSITRTPVAAAGLVCHDVAPGAQATSSFPGRITELGRWIDRAPGPVEGKVAVARTVVEVARVRADLVHAHFAHQIRLAAATSRWTRRPWVVSLYGRDLLVELRSDPDAVALVNSASAVIVLSEYLAGEAVDIGIDPSLVSVVPLGVDPDEFPAAPPEHDPSGDDGLRVLFVGRFVGKKGVLDAADALRRAVDAGTDVRARFVGSGPLRDELAARCEPIADRVSIEPGDDRTVVLDAFRRADVVLSPSRTDADGDRDTLLVVNLEAQACGVPVVTTRIGGIPEAVAPGAGVLVEEGDVVAAAAALVELGRDPERRREMGRAGARWVHAERTAHHTGLRLAAVYEAAIDGGPHDRRTAGRVRG